MKKILFVISLVLVSLFSITFSVFASSITWSETQPAGDVDVHWTNGKISRDGSVILIGANGGRLYVSRNSGTSWVEAQPAGDSDNTWLITGISSDGQKMIAGNYGDRLYISNDAGTTWIDTKAAGDISSNWEGGAMSGDGQTIIAGTNPGRLYLSTNGGSTWSETRPAGDNDEQWIPMAMSDNGQVIVAGVYGGRLYLSTNQGASWSEIRPAGDNNLNWSTVGLDKTGQKFFVGVDDAGNGVDPATGNLYLSNDQGSSWSEVAIGLDTGSEWRISSVSDDGQTMLAGYGDSASDGRLYLSTNGGSTWAETQPAGDNGYLWIPGGVSGDGYTFFAGMGATSGTSRLYKGTLPRPQSSSPSSTSTPSCGVTLISSPDLFQINTTKNEAKLFFAPVGNASNYQISYGYDSNADQYRVLTNQGPSTGVLSYTINELLSGSTMYFKVYGQNDCGQGNWSNTMSVKVRANKIYYKNLISQVIATLLPQKNTVLGASTSMVVSANTCTSYTVQAGDSLWKIASQNLGSGKNYVNIMHANNLSNTLLRAGQTLRVGC